MTTRATVEGFSTEKMLTIAGALGKLPSEN
jgi:hypothetical protein